MINNICYGMGPWTFEKLLSFLLSSARWGVCFRLHTLLCLSHLSFNTKLSNGRYKKTSLHWTPALWNREYTSKRCELFPSQCHLTASWFLISPVVHIHFTSQESTASALFSLTTLFSLGKQSLEEWMPTALSDACQLCMIELLLLKHGDMKGIARLPTASCA